MKHMGKQRLAVLIAVAALLMVAVCGSIAYLVASTDPLVNTFSPTDVDVGITDEIEDKVKKDVVITNTGTTAAYIRARIVGSWVSDTDGTVVQAWNPSEDGEFDGLPGTKWVVRDGYYYYTEPVAPNATTAPLFTRYEVTETVDGAHLVLDILVQAIQAGGNAAQDAWGGIPTASPSA